MAAAFVAAQSASGAAEQFGEDAPATADSAAATPGPAAEAALTAWAAPAAPAADTAAELGSNSDSDSDGGDSDSHSHSHSDSHSGDDGSNDWALPLATTLKALVVERGAAVPHPPGAERTSSSCQTSPAATAAAVAGAVALLRHEATRRSEALRLESNIADATMAPMLLGPAGAAEAAQTWLLKHVGASLRAAAAAVPDQDNSGRQPDAAAAAGLLRIAECVSTIGRSDAATSLLSGCQKAWRAWGFALAAALTKAAVWVDRGEAASRSGAAAGRQDGGQSCRQ